MVKEKNMQIMATEVLEILKYCTKEDRKKIPPKLIKALEEIKIKDLKIDINPNKEIAEQNITEEAKIMMFIIFRKYWATEEEKVEFDKLLEENQKRLEEKYSVEKIFSKKTMEKTEVETVELVKYKQSIFEKVVNWIKNIFK